MKKLADGFALYREKWSDSLTPDERAEKAEKAIREGDIYTLAAMLRFQRGGPEGSTLCVLDLTEARGKDARVQNGFISPIFKMGHLATEWHYARQFASIWTEYYREEVLNIIGATKEAEA